MGHGHNRVRLFGPVRVDLLHLFLRREDQTTLQACEVLLICKLWPALGRLPDSPAVCIIDRRTANVLGAMLDRALGYGSIEFLVERRIYNAKRY